MLDGKKKLMQKQGRHTVSVFFFLIQQADKQKFIELRCIWHRKHTFSQEQNSRSQSFAALKSNL